MEKETDKEIKKLEKELKKLEAKDWEYGKIGIEVKQLDKYWRNYMKLTKRLEDIVKRFGKIVGRLEKVTRKKKNKR